MRLPLKQTGPTVAIVEFARRQPGGIITWGEAERLYIRNSKSAKRESVNGSRHYANTLSKIMRRYFSRVYQQLEADDYDDIEEEIGFVDEHLPWRTARGLYVLKDFLEPEVMPAEPVLEEPDVAEDGTQFYFLYSMTQLIEAYDPFNRG